MPYEAIQCHQWQARCGYYNNNNNQDFVARKLMVFFQGQAGINAKIERKEALDHLDATIQASE